MVPSQMLPGESLRQIIHKPCDRCIGIFSDFLPRPDASSSNLRVYEMVTSLAKAGYLIHYHWWLTSDDDADTLRGFDTNITFQKIEREAGVIVNSVFEHGLSQVWFTNLWGTDWLHCVREAAEEIRDLNPDISIIADTMDYHAKKYYRKFDYTGDEADRELADAFFDAEKALYQTVNGIVTVANQEARDIAGAFDTTPALHVVGNIHHSTQPSTPFDQREGFVFLGNYRVPHNIDAVSWFLDFVYPELNDQLPGARLHLVGKHAEEIPDDITDHPGVTVDGYASDIPQAMSRYRAMIAPLTYGAGMKGKIGSAAACGLPVVTTSIGAEGYRFINGQHAFVTDDPTAFARHCVKLHTQQELWETVSENIRRSMSGSLSGERVIAELLRITEGYETRQSASSEILTGAYATRSLPEFLKIMEKTDRKDRIAIIEPTPSHQETFHSLIEYCNALGYGVDFILRSEMRQSRDILETLKDVAEIDAVFFYVLNPETVGDCVLGLNTAGHRAVMFNTLFEYWLRDGLMDSPHWEQLRVPERYAYLHHRTKFEQSTIRYPVIPDANVFALSENVSDQTGAALLSPSYFHTASYGHTHDSHVTRFVCVGGMDDQRRDYRQLLQACAQLNEQGFSDYYQVDLIGGDYSPEQDWTDRYKQEVHDGKLEQNIRIHGEIPFHDMFSFVSQADYMLFLINMETPYSREYLDDKITGSLSLSLGFGIVPILDFRLAENWDLHNSAVTYGHHQSFYEAMLETVQHRVPYADLQRSLKNQNTMLTTASIDNLRNRLRQS